MEVEVVAADLLAETRRMYSMTSLQEAERRRQVVKDMIIKIHGIVVSLDRLAKVDTAVAIGQKAERHKELAEVVAAAFTAEVVAVLLWVAALAVAAAAGISAACPRSRRRMAPTTPLPPRRARAAGPIRTAWRASPM